MSKDKTTALVLSLGELGLLASDEQDELWEDEQPGGKKNIFRMMTAFYDSVNPEYESLIERLKKFTTNEVEIQLVIGLLATYRNVKSATMTKIKFGDIKAISSKLFQKNTQIQVDFSFASQIWTQLAANLAHRTSKFVE